MADDDPSLSSAIEALRLASWRVDFLPEAIELPADVVSRYPALPFELVALLGRLGRCSNPADTAWLLGAPDLNGTAGSAFAWNELELMSLEAATDDEDAEAVRAFWDRHFPFLLSVKTGYAFFAVVLDGPHEGQVVYGVEPIFEDVTTAAPSLGAFFADLARAARGEVDLGSLGATI